jgi:hypothetical protein
MSPISLKSLLPYEFYHRTVKGMDLFGGQHGVGGGVELEPEHLLQ